MECHARGRVARASARETHAEISGWGKGNRRSARTVPVDARGRETKRMGRMGISNNVDNDDATGMKGGRRRRAGTRYGRSRRNCGR